MSIEESINDLIARMTEVGFEYESEDSEGIMFDVIGYSGTLRLKNWDVVENFCKEQEDCHV